MPTKRRHDLVALGLAVALVAAVVVTVFGRAAQSGMALPASAAQSSPAAVVAQARIAFVRSTLYACCGRAGPTALYVMNANGSGKRLLTHRVWGGLAWSPDGRKIAFDGVTRDGKSEIYLINADGSGKRRLTRNAVGDSGPSWSPDGRKIAFSRGPMPNQVYVMNADGSGQRRLTHLAAHNMNPAWLPNGKITFESIHGPNDFAIYAINADGSGQRNLSREWRLDNTFPIWSPDAQKIAFASKRDGNWEVYVMNADGSGQRNLTRNAANDNLYGHLGNPWSPDGRKIVFGRDRNGDGGSDDIYVINADGSGERNLTRGRKPLWSPDGQKISFTSKHENWAEIYVMNPDGSGQQRLTHSPARKFNDSLAWSPAQNK